ncbi:GNAT family N-acetyltransferase [Thermogemmatispora onikobensis]|uniref:GNAT family N-acetyltransferase n=1 Tax=Thermogemmatispora onikobensis TaxID=732234 RepID=UPI000853BE47|nr:GNAT family N-acetyltransferase [Thermogemmatispora onikobensis]
MRLIRRATSDDIATLTALRLALLRETGRVTDDQQEQLLRELTDSYLRRALPQEEFLVWVAEVDEQGTIAATGGLVFLSRPPSPENEAGLEGYVLNMYTLPAWRGQGLARAILRQIIAYARQHTSARRLWLHASDAGRPLYASEGFLPITREMELLW